MLKPDGTVWLADIAKAAPKLNQDDTTQIAAFPLGSWLKTDPWSDQELMLNAKRYAAMNARDKKPLEMTAIYYKLQRYDSRQTSTTTAEDTASPSSPATENDAGANTTGSPH